MEKIRTLVVDDEPLALDLVKGYVEQTPFLTLAGSCDNAADAYEKLRSDAVDLLYVDVQMPGMSGLSLVKSLTPDIMPKVVFTTAFAEYAVEGFKLDAVDYLLKPFDFDEFIRTAAKAQRLIELENAASMATEVVLPPTPDEDFIFVKSEYKLVKIELQKIVYIEGLKDYIKIYTSDDQKPILTLQSLKVIEKRLPAMFKRVHRSYIVNIAYVCGLERNLIVMPDGRIPMGEGFKQDFLTVVGRKTL